jgi:hypothetical protein
LERVGTPSSKAVCAGGGKERSGEEEKSSGERGVDVEMRDERKRIGT